MWIHQTIIHQLSKKVKLSNSNQLHSQCTVVDLDVSMKQNRQLTAKYIAFISKLIGSQSIILEYFIL